MRIPWASERAHIGQAIWCSSHQVRPESRPPGRLAAAITGRRPTATAPRPSQKGSYVAPNGTNACRQRMSTYASTTDGDDVHAEHHEREQRSVAMQRLDDEARHAPAGRPPSDSAPRTTVIVSSTMVTAPLPQLRYRRTGPSITDAPTRPTFDIEPPLAGGMHSSVDRDEAGSDLMPVEHGTAASPRTTAAEVAVLAAAQDGPVAISVRQTSAAGRPVRGSSRWWWTAPDVSGGGSGCWTWRDRRR